VADAVIETCLPMVKFSVRIRRPTYAKAGGVLMAVSFFFVIPPAYAYCLSRGNVFDDKQLRVE
jgi:hypothetical protein